MIIAQPLTLQIYFPNIRPLIGMIIVFLTYQKAQQKIYNRNLRIEDISSSSLHSVGYCTMEMIHTLTVPLNVAALNIP